MSDGKTMNRWLVVLGAVLIQLCLGAIYAWSVFTPSLTDQAGSMAGLMVIGCIKLFGIDALKSSGMEEAAASAAAGTAMAVFFALANGLGRIGWGVISDKLGRRVSLGLMFLFSSILRRFHDECKTAIVVLPTERYLGCS